MFGDIVKVTPTSKVVGDMALMMVTSGLTPHAVLDPDTQVAFPESVVSLFRGELGQPEGGFPRALQRKVLKGAQPLTERPGKSLPDIDLEQARAEVNSKTWRPVTDEELTSYLMYPKVFVEYMQRRLEGGRVSTLPTPVFFYGLAPGEEVTFDIERGKTLIVRFVALGELQSDGTRTLFFELNGQPRSVKIRDRAHVATLAAKRKAESGNAAHVGAPMPGTIVIVAVSRGSKVRRGDTLITIEAMKMETAVRADRDATIANVHVHAGEAIDAKDLLVEYSAPTH
jgi:pyruvate carboxylase